MRKPKKRIGIFGGSFNPIHIGHMQMAELAVEKLKLDLLYLVPVGNPSHKCSNELACEEDRLEMVKIACEEIEKLVPCDYEITTNKVSYTYDTLLKIIQLHPNSDIFEIIGEDSAEYLCQWKNYNEMKKLCQFVFFKRKGYNAQSKNIKIIDSPIFNVSSTIIREKISKNKSIEGLVNKKIITYILEKNLYK